MAIDSPPVRLRQEDGKFKTSLSYVARLCLKMTIPGASEMAQLVKAFAVQAWAPEKPVWVIPGTHLKVEGEDKVTHTLSLTHTPHTCTFLLMYTVEKNKF